MTNDSPFSDEKRVWLERRMRELIEEETASDAGGGMTLDLSDLTIEEDDSPPDCPQCGGPQYRELGREEPLCPSCD